MHDIVLHFMRLIVKDGLLLFSCPASKFTVICKLIALSWVVSLNILSSPDYSTNKTTVATQCPVYHMIRAFHMYTLAAILPIT